MIAGLFTNALRTALGEGAAIFDYGNSEEFTALWTSADGVPEILSRLTDEKAIIIVWEGAAQTDRTRAEKLLEPHLTPLDWALAFSNAVIEKKRDHTPNLRIHIIDLTSKRFEDVWSIRMRHQLLAEMPWVTLHGPLLPDGELPAYREGYQPILALDATAMSSCRPLLLKIKDGGWGLAGKGKSFSASIGQGRGKGLKDLAKQWMALLTQSDDHHDVNNVIGPDILAKSNERRQGIFGAFVTRLEWTGHDLDAASNWTEWNASERIGGDLFKLNLHAYVVDDNLEQGWARFLCRLLGGEEYNQDAPLAGTDFKRLNTPSPTVALFGCQSPSPLTDFLRDEAAFDWRDYASQLSDGDPLPELIFLDLRLYAGKEEAREQAQQLLDIVQTKVAAPLAWKNIDQDEIARIRAWSTGANDHERIADEALLLLPRLLALALPLTPIILFSSTAQAWIKERLKPYQNIFTGFEKPRVLSDPALIETSLAALREGLDKAVKIMRLRLQLAQAQAAHKKADRQRPPKDQRIANHHVEIYADETGELENGITSGLAVCFFADVGAAETLQACLWREHQRSGTVWTKLPNGPVPGLWKGTDIRRNVAEANQQTSLLANFLNNLPGKLADDDRALWSVVAIRMPPVKQPLQGRVSVAAFPDGPVDEALRFNLEFTLHGLIPYYSEGKDGDFKGTIRIHLPSRVVPNRDQDFANKLCIAFDLGEAIQCDKDPRKWLVPSANLLHLQKDAALGTAFPLVRGWLHEWRGTSHGQVAGQITRIKMTKLTQGLKGIISEHAKNRRLFHDIADWVCAASVDLSARQLKEQLTQKNLFPKWFLSTDNTKIASTRAPFPWYELDGANALILMHAAKASSLGDFVDDSGTDALRMVLRNYYVETCNKRLLDSEHCAQQRVILWMLRHEIDDATGASLHSLLGVDPSRSRLGSAASPTGVDGEPPAEPPAQDAGTGVDLAVAKEFHREREKLPELFDEAARIERFPEYSVYEVVKTTKRGVIFLKPEGDPAERGSHCTQNISLAYDLDGEGWANPKVILAIEPTKHPDPAVAIYLADTEREEISVRPVAVKLADGRWKSLGPR